MNELTTARMKWGIHRVVTLVDSTPETALAAATGNWAAIIAAYDYDPGVPKRDGLYRLSPRHNKISIRFRTDGTNNKTFSAKLYLIKHGDDAKLVGAITGVFGTRQATEHITVGDTTLYADTLTCVSSFPNTFAIDSAGGDDEMALISGDCAGWDYALVLITAADEGTATKKIAVDITGW